MPIVNFYIFVKMLSFSIDGGVLINSLQDLSVCVCMYVHILIAIVLIAMHKLLYCLHYCQGIGRKRRIFVQRYFGFSTSN